MNRFWCWWNNVCPKHFTKKEARLSPSVVVWICTLCEEEKERDFDNLLAVMRKVRLGS